MRQPEYLSVSPEKIINTSAEMADFFNIHFTTVADKIKSSLRVINDFDFTKLSQFVKTQLGSDDIKFSLPKIKAEEVATYLSKILSNKVAGVDGVSIVLLIIGIQEVAPSIAKLINLSFATEWFPARWKTARVAALHKAGELLDVNNYRPISVLPVLSKVIERHVHNCLSNYLSDNNLIYSNQSGFRKKFSTETALTHIVDSLLFNLDKNHVTGMGMVDYKKAFDMVDHSTLLKNLEEYGLEPNALSRFRSYLTDRKQLVTFKGQSSTARTVTTGEPQGSVLGPLLFVIFINDLPLYINMQVDLFADDTTHLASADYTCIDELKEKLSHEVSNVDDWTTAIKLLRDSLKTKIKTILITGKRLKTKLTTADQELHIELNGTHLEQVDHVKLLGLELDEELSFNYHVQSLSKKMSKRIGILNRIKSYLPRAE